MGYSILKFFVSAPSLVWPLLGVYLLVCLIRRRRPHAVVSTYLLAAMAMAAAIYSTRLGYFLGDTLIYVTWAPLLAAGAATVALELGMFVAPAVAAVGFTGAVFGILRSGAKGRLLIPLLAGPVIGLAAIWAQSAASRVEMSRASADFKVECRELRSLRESLAGMSTFDGGWFFQDYHGVAMSNGRRFLWSYASGGWVELNEEAKPSVPFPAFPASCNA